MGMNVKDQYITDRYAMYCGDTTEVIKGVANDSVGLIVYSPPFSSLYTYSNRCDSLTHCLRSSFERKYALLITMKTYPSTVK